jgi:hypothetical protein
MWIIGMTSLATFLISLINCTFASHVYSLMVYFIAHGIFLSPQCSASNTHTLSLSLSLCYLALFSSPSIWYKIHGKHFHVIIDYNKLFQFTLLFHIEVARNIIYIMVLSDWTLMIKLQNLGKKKIRFWVFEQLFSRQNSLCPAMYYGTQTLPNNIKQYIPQLRIVNCTQYGFFTLDYCCKTK